MAEVDDLIATGWARRFSDPEASLGAFSSALELARTIRAPQAVGRAAVGCGQIRRDMGDLNTAAALYAEAVEQFRISTDEESLASTLRHLGDIYLDAGQYDKARVPLEEALASCRKTSGATPLTLANALRPMALLIEATGGDFIPLWQEARELYQQAGVEAGVEECEAHLLR